MARYPEPIRGQGASSSRQTTGHIGKRLGLLCVLLLAIAMGGPVQVLKSPIGTAAWASSQSASYPFPGRAEDLQSGHYWYIRDKHWSGGSQEWAYDLLGVRFDSEEGWTTLNPGFSSATSNGSKILYGKPVHAIADGEVFACWRNAPENPAPGQRHSEAPGYDEDKTPRISFAGNFLFVELTNGQRVLYAHFQSGSIPASLCPISKTLFSTPVSAIAPAETRLPAGSRPQVKQGQFLGDVGNSGNSSEPHLHIHVQTAGGDPVRLRFRGVWVKSTELAGGIIDFPYRFWSYLDGDMLPLEPTAILPSYSRGFAEIARHGVRTTDYQFIFEHIARSGYRPVWVDGYDVNGQTYLNVIFRPADRVRWVARHGLSSRSYQAEFDKWTEEGFRLLQVDSYVEQGEIRYAAIFVKQSGPSWRAYHGRTADQHEASFQSLTRQGYRPVNISVVSVSGRIRVTALYEKKNVGSYYARTNIPVGEYQSEFNQNDRAGRQLVYLNAWTHRGRVFFSGIWNSATSGAFVARHGLTSSQYQTQWQQWTGQAYLTRFVTGYGIGSPRFAALWRK